MVFVQALLDARLRPVRQRLERADVRLLVKYRIAPENILCILARFLPRAVPYEPTLCNLTSKYMFFECKVQHISREDDARLQQLLETPHGSMPKVLDSN